MLLLARYSLAAAKNLYIIGLYDVTIPNLLIGDATRLSQILLNFLSNAVKFTSEGGVTLSIEKTGEEECSIELLFRVIDTGIGMESGETEQLFEKFYQTEAGRTRQGTGLGLAISKQLAMMMGGDVGVHSKKGKGSTFWLRVSQEIDKRDKSAPFSSLCLTEPRQVLIVDNREYVRVFLTHHLKQWGVQARVVLGLSYYY